MSKKEININSSILKKLFYSYLIAFGLFFILEINIVNPKYGCYYGSYAYRYETAFGESGFTDNPNKILAILETLFNQETDVYASLILTAIIWLFFLIFHFFKFKIK